MTLRRGEQGSLQPLLDKGHRTGIFDGVHHKRLPLPCWLLAPLKEKTGVRFLRAVDVAHPAVPLHGPPAGARGNRR